MLSDSLLAVKIRTCIHSRGKLEGRGFFPPDKENRRSMMRKRPDRQCSAVVNTGSKLI